MLSEGKLVLSIILSDPLMHLAASKGNTLVWAPGQKVKVGWGHGFRRPTFSRLKLCVKKIEGKKRRGQQRMRWLHSSTDSMNMNLSNLQETVKDRGAWHAGVHGVRKNWTQLSE